MIQNNWAVKAVERFIFNVRWVLNLFYLGLIVVLFLYGYSYVKEIIHLLVIGSQLSMSELEIIFLDTIDVVMIANLSKMVITGSYNSFVSKTHGYANENISSGMLKNKIATSIVVVAAIHLLKEFVNEHAVWEVIVKQLWIYGAFLLTAVVLGALEYLHIKGEVLEHKLNHSKDHHEESSSQSHAD